MKHVDKVYREREIKCASAYIYGNGGPERFKC